jgi:hypothetical protein
MRLEFPFQVGHPLLLKGNFLYEWILSLTFGGFDCHLSQQRIDPGRMVPLGLIVAWWREHLLARKLSRFSSLPL